MNNNNNYNSNNDNLKFAVKMFLMAIKFIILIHSCHQMNKPPNKKTVDFQIITENDRAIYEKAMEIHLKRKQYLEKENNR